MLEELCKGTDSNHPWGSWKSVAYHSCLNDIATRSNGKILEAVHPLHLQLCKTAGNRRVQGRQLAVLTRNNSGAIACLNLLRPGNCVSYVWVCMSTRFYFALQNLLSAGQPSLINISVQFGECIMAMVLQLASTNQVQWLVWIHFEALKDIEGFLTIFSWHILFGIGVQHATSFNYTMKLAACWFLSNVHRTYIVSFYFMVSWDWGFTFSFPFFPFFPSACSVASKITEVLWIMKV